MINRFLSSNTPSMKLARTIFQGVVGVLVANLDAIIGTLSFSAEAKGIIVACVMAVLSPLMAQLGGKTK